MTKQRLQKFITYFVISSIVYYLFLIVEAISLYFNEYGFDLTNAILTSFCSIESVINFGVFISLILITPDLLKVKLPISTIFKLGIIISVIFGGTIFFLSNSIVPELRMNSYLDRYENARKKTLSSDERQKKINDLRTNKANMMSIGLINKLSDSLKKSNLSQEKIISNLIQNIPDSIIQSNLSKKELASYSISKNKSIPDFNRRDLSKLKVGIRKNESLEKQLRTSNWEKSKRYLNIFQTLFLASFGVIIGQNFKKQKLFSLVCIGIVIYSQTLTLLALMVDYFVDEKNLIGLIFKLLIILTLFLYLIYRMTISKNTSANTV